MTKYVIQSNIPIPPRRGPGRNPESFVGKLRALKKGQSIFKSGDRGSIATVAIRALGKGKATVRRVNGGYRIWRIK